MNKSRFSLSVQILDEQSSTKVLRLKGRPAWALRELVKAGPSGCTPINQPAPRWAAYVHDLREAGISIETVTEPHGGTFAGTHARYVLRSQAEILPEVAQ